MAYYILKANTSAKQVTELELYKQSMEDQVVEFNDVGPLVFEHLLVDYLHTIISWIDQHPEEVAKKTADRKRCE